MQGYAFAGDEILRRELEACRPSSRVRLEQVLGACEKEAGMDIETTYHELLALMNEIVTGYGIVGRSLQKLPLVRERAKWQAIGEQENCDRIDELTRATPLFFVLISTVCAYLFLFFWNSRLSSTKCVSSCLSSSRRMECVR